MTNVKSLRGFWSIVKGPSSMVYEEAAFRGEWKSMLLLTEEGNRLPRFGHVLMVTK